MIRQAGVRVALALAGFAAALVPGALVAQEPATGTVGGTVVDSATGSGIDGARVTVRRSRSAISTWADGRFVIAAVPGDTLLVQAIGYRTRRVVVSGGSLRVGLAPDVAHLGDLVVTASRRVESARTSPIAVSAIPATEIESRSAASVDQAVRDVPALQVLPTAPTGATLTIRGMGGSRVLVLVDGEPVAGNLLENRDLSRVSTLAVERIEVVKGPMSALYGSDAIGGVVNVITRDPSGPLRLDADLRAGDLGRRDLRLGASAGGAVAFRVDGGLREQGAVPSITPQAGALSRVWDLRATGRWAASGSWLLRADANVLRERQRWQVSADGFNGFNDNRALGGFAEAGWSGSRTSLRARVAAEHYTHLFRQSRASAPLASDSTPDQVEYAVKTTAVWSRSHEWGTLDLGVEAAHRAIESPGKLAGPTGDELVDGYAQLAARLGAVTVQPAVRAGWSSRWGGQVTPNVAALVPVGDALRFRASVGTGFRGPSFKELAWDFPNVLAGYTLRGNPDLLPERSVQVAVGGEWQIRDDLALDGELFQNRIRNLIELGEAGADPATGLVVYAARNVARARTAGAEANLRWDSGPWNLAAGYAWLSARDLTLDQPLDRRAAHRATLRAAREFGAGRHLAAVTVGYTGDAPTTGVDGGRATQASLLDVGAFLRVGLLSGLSASAGVDNVLDARPDGWVGLLGRRISVGLSARIDP